MTTTGLSSGDSAGTSIRDDLTMLVATAWALDRGRVLAQAVLLVLAGLLGGVGLVLLVPIVNSLADTDNTIAGAGDRQPRCRIAPALVAVRGVRGRRRRPGGGDTHVDRQLGQPSAAHRRPAASRRLRRDPLRKMVVRAAVAPKRHRAGGHRRSRSIGDGRQPAHHGERLARARHRDGDRCAVRCTRRGRDRHRRRGRARARPEQRNPTRASARPRCSANAVGNSRRS